jgi:hypothetical protein
MGRRDREIFEDEYRNEKARLAARKRARDEHQTKSCLGTFLGCGALLIIAPICCFFLFGAAIEFNRKPPAPIVPLTYFDFMDGSTGEVDGQAICVKKTYRIGPFRGDDGATIDKMAVIIANETEDGSGYLTLLAGSDRVSLHSELGLKYPKSKTTVLQTVLGPPQNGQALLMFDYASDDSKYLTLNVTSDGRQPGRTLRFKIPVSGIVRKMMGNEAAP